MMEDVSGSAIKQHPLSSNLLSDAQIVIRQGHSARPHYSLLVQTWTKELNSRGEVTVTALDIKAAFDRVCLITLLGDIISEASNEAMLFYSAWNLHCLIHC
eukprot:g45987.t1